MWGWDHFIYFCSLFLAAFDFGPLSGLDRGGGLQVPLGIKKPIIDDRVSGTCQDPQYVARLPSNKGKCIYNATHKHPNTPTTRNVWCGGMDICTNYETTGNYPRGNNAGQVREYTFEIAYKLISPDGGPSKLAQLVNRTYPGPVLEAWWGDTIVLNVINKLRLRKDEIANGTSIHAHGLRQWFSVGQDGVPGVTQCPITPFKNMTYKYGDLKKNNPLMQYGNSWYHSHFSLQYPNGVAGPILLHGPTSANWDIDLGPILITDYYQKNAFELYHTMLSDRTPADSVLINGVGCWPKLKLTDPKCRFWENPIKFQPGKAYLLRFVNTATDMHFRVSLDQHEFIVISSDFVPVRPFTTKSIDIGIGQRYEVVVQANQSIGNYWLRTEPIDCEDTTSVPPQNRTALGIIRYQGSTPGLPTSPRHHLPARHCYNMEPLVPMIDRGDKIPDHIMDSAVLFNVSVTDFLPGPPNNSGLKPNHSMSMWEIANYSMWLNWSDPVTRDISDPMHIFPDRYALINEFTTPKKTWAVFHINGKYTALNNKSDHNVTHPIHLHGHDYLVLAQGNGSWNRGIGLTTINPTRRDVALLPGNGYLILAFKLDNPGVWLMHCHIAWHASEGLGLLVVENPLDATKDIIDYDQLQENCASWDSWVQGHPPPPPNWKEDSGV